jgi:hypothetical protein
MVYRDITSCLPDGSRTKCAGYRNPEYRHLLLGAALLMMLTGALFAMQTAFWPLRLIAFVGAPNPGSGDVSVFLPLEHARLAEAAQGHSRTALFARYSLLGGLFAALGALASGLPEWLVNSAGITRLTTLRGMFLLYGLVGGIVWLLYRRLPQVPGEIQQPPAPLSISRPIIIRLATFFHWTHLPEG